MAVLHHAEISPTKQEMLARWVPEQPWFAGDDDAPDAALELLGAYRFDDPDGDVGLEVFLVRQGAGPVLQVPVTYRGRARHGAGSNLVTEMEHSVLGRRWVYDGPHDPVFVAALARAVLGGGEQAEVAFADGTPRDLGVRVRGTGREPVDLAPPPALDVREDGEETIVGTPDLAVVVRRVLSPAAADHVRDPHLVGTWSGQETPVLLAVVRRP